MQRENAECSLFRAIFGPRPDEPIAELIDIIYSYIVSHYVSSENKIDQSQCRKERPTVPFKEDSNDNTKNEGKAEELLSETKIKSNFMEQEPVNEVKAIETAPVMSSTSVGEAIYNNNVIDVNSESAKLSQSSLESPVTSSVHKSLPKSPSAFFIIGKISQKNSQFFKQNDNEKISSKLIPNSEENQSPEKTGPKRDSIQQRSGLRDSVRDQISLSLERINRKLQELSTTLVQSKPLTLKSPQTTAVDTKYGIIKKVKYADETEVFQIVRYLKRYELKTTECKHCGLKSFVRMPNGVIVPYEDIGDHQR